MITPTPYPTFIPDSELIKAEYVSMPLLIFQLFIVGCVLFTVCFLYFKLNKWSSGELSEQELEVVELKSKISDLAIKLHNATKDISFNLDELDDEEEVDDDDQYLRCVYCGTSNLLDARQCVACGAPRKKAFA